MVDGEIVISDSKDNLLSNWKKIHFNDNILTNDIENKLLAVTKQTFGSSGLTNKYEKISELLKEDIASGDIKVENINLDDILISLVKES